MHSCFQSLYPQPYSLITQASTQLLSSGAKSTETCNLRGWRGAEIGSVPGEIFCGHMLEFHGNDSPLKLTRLLPTVQVLKSAQHNLITNSLLASPM